MSLVGSIINDERETGISLFILDDGVDSVDIIGQKAEPILITLCGDQESDVIDGIDHAEQTKIESGSIFNSHRTRATNR